MNDSDRAYIDKCMDPIWFMIQETRAEVKEIREFLHGRIVFSISGNRLKVAIMSGFSCITAMIAWFGGWF